VSGTGIHRILVVDDEPDILAVTRMTLQARGGYDVAVCPSGREALELAPQFQPDLILLDVMMPEMDGLMTLAALRDDPRMITTPVVFMTAKTMRHETDRYLDLGAVGVVAKPFDPRTLVEELERIVTGNSNPSLWSDREMASLLASYSARLPEKVREIRTLWEQVELGADGAADRLHRSVHRTAGTAGTFGYTSLSEIAGQLDQKLQDCLRDGLVPTVDNRRQVGLLVDALEKSAFEPPETLT
jgi:CheY-like chemotaxis protein